MIRDERFQQLAGPIIVVGAIFCAELAAHALAIWPTSSFLWYLNLQVFQPIRHSFASLAIGNWLGIGKGSAQAIWLPVAAFGLVGLGLTKRTRLALAIASNLSFIYSAALLYYAFVTNAEGWGSFRLSGLQSPSCALAAAILVISLLSSTVSHRNYWRQMFS